MANNHNNGSVKDLKIDMVPDVAKGTYSNLAIISHSPSEIILDFAQILPGIDGAAVRQRIIMNPIHAKRLLMALSGNVKKYEETFGVIDEPHGPNDAIPYNMVPQGKA